MLFGVRVHLPCYVFLELTTLLLAMKLDDWIIFNSELVRIESNEHKQEPETGISQNREIASHSRL